MAQNNKAYTNEFKEKAIKLALNSVSISGAAKDLGARGNGYVAKFLEIC